MKYVTYRITIHGIVQGVGFRPAVDRIANSLSIGGYVSNKGSFVEVVAEAEEEKVLDFINEIKANAPERSVIIKINHEKIAESDQKSYDAFSIGESEKIEGEIYISPDIAICSDCKNELFDKENKRYLHPFINCTQCGPRFTIIESLPYDRERTTMKAFPMCGPCEGEYFDPATRRYDAQPVCCPDCGPEVYVLWERDGGERQTGSDAITRVRRLISEGKIAAIKGIGGFHLCCDATNDEACKRLRNLKQRHIKPFAVMGKDLDAVSRECDYGPAEEKILTGHIKPILLLDKKNPNKVDNQDAESQKNNGIDTDVQNINSDTDSGSAPRLSQYIAPQNPKVGFMLPYAPLHLLLFDYPDGIEMPDCLVMTSANDSGAPIIKDDEGAMAELTDLCDIILSNNRDILTRADDSVMEMIDDKPYMIRRSRGYAPLPVMMDEDMDVNVLAVGSELKNTVTVSRGNLYYPSAHIGDLGDMRSLDALKDATERMVTLLETTPEVIACDMHPKYSSVKFAMDLADQKDIPVIEIQHHYSHIVSCMAENDEMGPVIGVSFDGTGYGTDATIWGGEIMYATLSDWERIGSVAPFVQIGGDASAREGWRIAASMLMDLDEEIGLFTGDEKADGLALAKRLNICTENEYQALMSARDNGVNSVLSTSAGRIFDAVCAILGIKKESEFEGDAATALMYAAERFEKKLSSSPEVEANYEALLGEWRAFAVKILSLRNEAVENGHLPKSMSVDSSVKGVEPETIDMPELREIMHTDIMIEFLTLQAIRSNQSEGGKDVLAYLFHDIMSDMVRSGVEAAPRKLVERIASEDGFEMNEYSMQALNEIMNLKKVAISGGVYQNRLLLKLTKAKLEKRGYKVLVHSLIPPNDGGISLGQAVAVAHIFKRYKEEQNL